MIQRFYRRCFLRTHLKLRGGRCNGFLFDPLDRLDRRLSGGAVLFIDLGSGAYICCASYHSIRFHGYQPLKIPVTQMGVSHFEGNGRRPNERKCA